MVEQIIFIVASAVTLISGVAVVTHRNIFHAALFLMLSFLGVAGLYVMLEAGFLAVAQLMVYIGAISILIIFSIMMTRRIMQADEAPYNSQYIVSLISAIGVFAVFVYAIVTTWTVDPQSGEAFSGVTPLTAEQSDGIVTRLGELFVGADALVVPFEVVSVMLLAALVGSIVIAWSKQEEDA